MRPQKGIDANLKNSIQLPEKTNLKPIDITRTDLAAIMALDLGETISGLIEQKRREYYNLLKREIENTLGKVLKEVENPETRGKIQILFECLLNICKLH